MIAIIAITAIACNKNQKAVRKLDGKWELTKLSYTEDGVTETETEFQLIWEFDNCKLKNNDFCSMTSTEIDGSDSYTYSSFYKVTGDGNTLVASEDLTGADTETLTIIELTNDVLVLEQNYGSEIVNIEFEKL